MVSRLRRNLINSLYIPSYVTCTHIFHTVTGYVWCTQTHICGILERALENLVRDLRVSKKTKILGCHNVC